jgi:hypothetical protein
VEVPSAIHEPHAPLSEKLLNLVLVEQYLSGFRDLKHLSRPLVGRPLADNELTPVALHLSIRWRRNARTES